jgi:Na+-driven multidrug efflux pump
MSKVDYTSSDVHRSLWKISAPMLLLSILDYLGIFVTLGWLLIVSAARDVPEVLRLCASIVGILEAGFGGLLSAVYIYANKYFGQKSHAAARHLINFGFGLTVILGLLVAVSGRLFAGQLLGLFEVSESVKSQVLLFLDTFWLGYVVIIAHIYSGLIAKMSGDIQLIMRFRVVTFVMNVIGTPLTILAATSLGFDALQGAAAGAILARVVGLVVLALQIKHAGVFPFRLGFDFVPRATFSEWRPLTNLAVAETINGFSLTLSFFLFFVIVSRFEAGTLAAVTVGQYFTGFFQAVLLGIVASIIPFTAQNSGIRSMDNIERGVRWMSSRVLGVSLVAGLTCMVLAPYFVPVFLGDTELAVRTIIYIRITALPWAFLMGSFTYIFAVVGLGDSKGTLLLTIWSMYLGNLAPLVLVLYFVGDRTELAAYAEAGAHLVTFFGCVLYYRWKARRLTLEWRLVAPSLVDGAPA